MWTILIHNLTLDELLTMWLQGLNLCTHMRMHISQTVMMPIKIFMYTEMLCDV